MKWLLHLYRFWWAYLGLVLVLTGIGAYIHHSIYESGYAASEAKWQGLFAAAAKARDEANEKARRTEESSRVLTERIEKQHADTMASLTSRAADAERRYADLLRQHSASSSRGAVPQDGGAAGDADATGASSELVDRTGRDFAALARRCEADAAALTDLQEWVRGQLAIQRD